MNLDKNHRSPGYIGFQPGPICNIININFINGSFLDWWCVYKRPEESPRTWKSNKPQFTLHFQMLVIWICFISSAIVLSISQILFYHLTNNVVDLDLFYLLAKGKPISVNLTDTLSQLIPSIKFISNTISNNIFSSDAKL